MKTRLEDALERARDGDEATLAGFGLRRRVTAGVPTPTGTFECEDTLTVGGDGVVTFSTVRSFADQALEPVGRYAGQLEPAAVSRLVGLVGGLDGLKPALVQPIDPQAKLNLTLGGVHLSRVLPLGDPGLLEQVAPLFDELERGVAEARKHPVATLLLRVSAGSESWAAGKHEVPLTLTLENAGSEGYWVTHPASLDRSISSEKLEATYALPPVEEPGVTPLPVRLQRVALRPVEAEAPELLWIPAQGSIDIAVTAELEFSAPGDWVVMPFFSTFVGEDTVAGRLRLRGCAFANRLEIRADPA